MSEEADDSQKTEDPTPKKLEDARKKGQIPRARELNHWFMILGGLIAVGAVLPRSMEHMTRTMAGILERSHLLHGNGTGLGLVLYELLAEIGIAMVLPLALFVVVALAPAAMQGSLTPSLESIKPKLEKLSPLSGAKRIFSANNLVEFLKGVVKILVVGVVVAILLMPTLEETERFVGLELGLVLNETYWLSLRILAGVLIVLSLVAGFDVVYQRFSFMKRMKMTKQEVKDEYKQTEGDPLVKNKLRQIRMERARRRMMAEVPKATVVVTNPTHYAVALKYEQGGMEAPKVVAKGVDKVALRIREVAGDHDIPIVENPPLARALHATVDLDDEIPPEHYKAVAEVISYVMKLRQGRK